MTASLPSRRFQRTALAAAFLSAALAAGCGSTVNTSSPQSPSAAAAATFPLATSMTVGGADWSVLVMGGPASQDDNFWQLFTLADGGTQWALVTPPGVADNGGLVLAPDTSGSSRLRVAFRPSQELVFSPLTSTSDSGRSWSPGLLNAAIASVPDALAAHGATLLALLANGTVDQSVTSGTTWTRLSRSGVIAGSAAARRCQVTSITAVSMTSSGTPLVGASCSKAGSSGIYGYVHGSWQATGPDLGSSGAAGQTRVLRLISTAAGNTALIATGTGRQERLFAAWTSDGTRWTVSPALQADGGDIRASGTGTGGLVWALFDNGHAVAIDGSKGAAWRALPAPPARTATLAALPGGAIDALAAAGSKLTVFRLASSSATWTQTQVIKVPIQYGSSS